MTLTVKRIETTEYSECLAFSTRLLITYTFANILENVKNETKVANGIHPMTNKCLLQAVI